MEKKIIKKKIKMKEFVSKNFTVIVLVIVLLSFFKSCNDSREITKIKKEITAIKDSTFTKTELSIELQISGLEAEKRMIQATDRKIFDVRRQSEIEEEIKRLKSLK
jgi:Fe2+ transport system protein B